MISFLKKQWQQLVDTAKQKAREHIVEGIFAILILFLYWIRNPLVNVLTTTLTKPIISWHIEEVLFSAICIMVIFAFIFLLIKQFKRKQPEFTTKEISFNSTQPTADEIYDEVNKQPPLLQDDFAKKYNGLKVKWDGIFSYIADNGNNKILVGVSPKKYIFYFDTSLDHFPIFRTLKLNEAYLQVSGTINLSTSTIHLDNAEIIDIKIIKIDHSN